MAKLFLQARGAVMGAAAATAAPAAVAARPILPSTSLLLLQASK